MSESFARKFSEKEVENLLDPTGFISEKDKDQYEGLNPETVKVSLDQKKLDYDRKKEEERRRMKKTVSLKEYGLRKKKINDPTRYGEWDVGGRTYDF